VKKAFWLIIPAVALAAALLWPRAEEPRFEKPTAPVSLDVRTDGPTDPGALFDLVVTAHARAGTDVAIEAVLPAGTVLHAGETTWTGPMQAGETRVLRLQLSVLDDTEREIMVRADCAIDAATRLTACESVVLHPAPAPASKGVLKTNSRGEGILDFPQDE
jgi:hypothetical protein